MLWCKNGMGYSRTINYICVINRVQYYFCSETATMRSDWNPIWLWKADSSRPGWICRSWRGRPDKTRPWISFFSVATSTRFYRRPSSETWRRLPSKSSLAVSTKHRSMIFFFIITSARRNFGLKKKKVYNFRFPTHPKFRREHRVHRLRQPFPRLGHVQPIVQVFVVHGLCVCVIGQTVFDQRTLSFQHETVSTSLLSHSLWNVKTEKIHMKNAHWIICASIKAKLFVTRVYTHSCTHGF